MSWAYDYDVAVVGASIAGCTVATLLGRSGARVALLERRSDAASYKTICTHFIQPSATPTIERLGLAERIEAAGGIRNGFEMWTRYGWIVRDSEVTIAIRGMAMTSGVRSSIRCSVSSRPRRPGWS